MKNSSFFISSEDTIHNIQDRFSRLFPRLTISFYSQNEQSQSADSCPMFSADCRISELNPHGRFGSIQIAEDMLAFEMENAIRDHFGLHAEIREWTADSQDSGGNSGVNSKNQETKLFFSQSALRYFGEIPFAC